MFFRSKVRIISCCNDLYKCKIFIALTDFIFPLQLMLFFYFFINLAPAKGTNYFPVFRIRISFYADPDPGFQKCPYGSGSESKEVNT